MKKILLLFLLGLKMAFSQEIGLVAKVEKNNVVLRWMPLDYATWQLGLKNGYEVYKQIGLDPNAPKQTLTKYPMLPLSDESWQKLSQKSKFAAVAAKLLKEPITNEPDAQNLNLGLSILMSNMDPGIALGMGMLYNDRTIKKSEKYTYTVKIKNTEIQSSITVNTEKLTVLQPPTLVRGEYADSTFRMRWMVTDSVLQSAYIIERSDDGGVNFKSISTEPILISEDPDSLGNTFVAGSNKLPRLYQNYFFRIRAITPFGQLSVPSKAMRVFGYIDKLPIPKLSHIIIKNKEVNLTWEFPDSLNKYILGFEVLHAKTLDGKYAFITPNRLTADRRTHLDSLPITEGYYRVAAIDWAGKQHGSYPEFVQLQDTIPPAKPLITVHTVDPKGAVRLRWKANKEPDLLGYSVFWGDNPKQEFSLATKTMAKDSIFLDTLALNLLNKKVYYTVIAYDTRLNASMHADTVLIIRPDTIRPSAPNFTYYNTSDTAVYLGWANSPSEDLDSTYLIRAEPLSGQVSKLLVFPAQDTTKSFIDTTGLDKTNYTYMLVAKDNAGLYSDTTQIVLQKLFTGVRKPIASLSFTYDIEAKTIKIDWPTPKQKVRKYLLYRQSPNESYISQYKIFGGNFGSFIDKAIEPNKPYSYRLMAELEDGSETKLSSTFTAILEQ